MAWSMAGLAFFQSRSVPRNQDLKSVFLIVNEQNSDLKIGSILRLLSFNMFINDILIFAIFQVSRCPRAKKS